MFKSKRHTKIFTIILTTFIFLSFLPFGIANNQLSKVFAQGPVNIIVDGKYIKPQIYPIIKENKIYIPTDFIKQYIHNDVELDKENYRFFVNITKPKFNLETENLNKKLENGVKLNFLTRRIDGNHYINIKGLEKIFGISLDYQEDRNTLVINKTGTEEKSAVKAVIQNRTYVKESKSSFSNRLEILNRDDYVDVLEKGNEWTKVKTEKGNIGYILSNSYKVKEVKIYNTGKLNTVREDFKPNGKINMTWDYVNKYSPDLSDDQKIEGLDVLSPTWFNLGDSFGMVLNRGDVNYVEEAHKKGYKVWAMFTNSFNKDLTRNIFNSEESQKKIINKIVVYSSAYNLDGINIDFENVYYEDKDKFTKFVQDLTNALKEQNIIVSVDMTVPAGGKSTYQFYDREKLGKIVDYCMVMTYDEHWSTSPVSGSVASIPWMSRGLENTFKYIPKEKVLVGIPLYTRRWEETKEADGKIKVKSKALSMKTANNMIKEMNLKSTWLNDIGQNYVEYNQDGKRYRIWIEDLTSISIKADLVNKYDLAGAATWRKGYEEEEVWDVLNSVVKKNEKPNIPDNDQNNNGSNNNGNINEKVIGEGVVTSRTYLRQEKSSFSKKLETLNNNDIVKIVEEGSQWTRVITEKGNIGYILSDSFKIKN